MGTMIDWLLTGHFYLTGLVSTAVTMGNYRNRAEQRTTFQPTAGDNTAIPVRNADYRDARPAFSAQALLGPSWQKNYSNSRMELFAGYELNAWFNLQEIYRSTSGDPSVAKETWINSSILALQGLTTRLTVDF